MVVVLDTVNDPRPRHPEKVHRPDTPALRKPDWIRVRAPVSKGYADTRDIVRAHGLHTVCEEAGCPNIGECWDKKHATFMIMGDTCTRACAFCNVKTGLARRARSRRARPRRRRGGEARPLPPRHHLGRPRRSRRRRRRPFRRGDSRGAGALPQNHDRGAHPGFPAQGRRRGEGDRCFPGRLQPQPRDRAVALSHRAAGRALFPLDPAVADGEGARSRGCSPSPASWSGSARRETRCSR